MNYCTVIFTENDFEEVEEMPEVIRTIDIDAPPSVVWRWLASEEALRRWLSPGLAIDLRVGGAYRMQVGDTWISGSVLEIVPEGRLVLSWFEEGGDWIHPARLSFTLVPIGAGTFGDSFAGDAGGDTVGATSGNAGGMSGRTRVTLSHDGFAGIGKPGWPGTVEAYERGADRHRVLERLAELVSAERVG